MKSFLTFSLVVLLASLWGCSKKSEEAAKPTTPSASGDASADGAAQQSDSVGQALEKYGHTMATAKKTALKKMDTISVDRAIQTFQADRGKNPASLDELVKEGFLPKLPDLPSGMKYNYNPQTGEVSVGPSN